MPAGDAFSPRQREDIERAVRFAQAEGDLEVAVFVGAIQGPSRGWAEGTHARLRDPDVSVLLAVDPAGRRLEVVAGHGLNGRLDDRACGLAAVAMTSAFSAGDLAGGIVNGIRSLAEHARRPRILHNDNV